MPDHQHIYQNEAEMYERMISYQPSLAPTVEEMIKIDGLDIIDLGAGTGRLACVLAAKAKSILLVDESAAMLKVASSKLEQAGHHNWHTQPADHRSIPAADDSADLVVIGWSLCYLASSNVQGWQDKLQQAILEIQRVLRPGGTCIIFETLGTGYETPVRYDFLQGYFEQLEQTYHFAHRWVRTDYHFTDAEEAEQLSRFFFGDGIADKLAEAKEKHLPECAGVWWRSF